MRGIRPSAVWLSAILFSTLLPQGVAGQDRISPYAAEAGRDIKALSSEEVSGLLEGAGLGFAKAAELNGVPGRRHVLELAAELRLTDDQRSSIERIYDRMHAGAVRLGESAVELERELDALFGRGLPEPEEVRSLASQIAEVRGRLRAVHLVAHLETAEILSAEQIRAYSHLRGYSGGSR